MVELSCNGEKTILLLCVWKPSLLKSSHIYWLISRAHPAHRANLQIRYNYMYNIDKVSFWNCLMLGLMYQHEQCLMAIGSTRGWFLEKRILKTVYGWLIMKELHVISWSSGNNWWWSWKIINWNFVIYDWLFCRVELRKRSLYKAVKLAT